MKHSSMLVVALLTLGLSSAGLARNVSQTEDIYPALRIDPYDGERSVYLDSDDRRFVKKIYLSADAVSCQSGTVEVKANGNWKGSLYVPCNGNGTAWININESVRSLQFRVSSGGALRVARVYFEMDPLCAPPCSGCATCVNCSPCPKPIVVQPISVDTDHDVVELDSWPNRPTLAWLAKRAKKITDGLRPHVDPAKDYVKYLVPIRTVAGHAQGVTMAEGDSSDKSKVAIQALADQITTADPLFTRLMKRELTFDLATEMVRVRDEIVDALD